MTGLVSMRVAAAGTRLQLPHTGTAFNQAAGGVLHAGPQKAALSKLQWGGRKVFPQIGWGEEEGRGEKGHALGMGNVEQGRAASVPGEGKWVPTQCPEHPAGEKARTGALQAAV